ncbi:MAG: type II toxin-antitoxin system prevent-host-death family antitoxin [Gemmatimonadaceae bacterium]
MATTGIRDLKNNLSRYLRRVAAGERIIVTAHGRAVAELRPSADASALPPSAIRSAVEEGDPLADWPSVPIKLARGSAAALLDEDRAEG